VAIPSEIIEWFRAIFASANRRLAEKLLNVPAIPESHLDTTLVEHLSGYATPRRFRSDWTIRLDTHYIGGLRHFIGRWEVADIGVLIFFQQRGRLIRRKVALLQSKRLYPKSGQVIELEQYDFMVGMARLGERDQNPPSMLATRRFRFDTSCRYRALISCDQQQTAMENHYQEYGIPIYYLFYNPPLVPLTINTPLLQNVGVPDNPTLGARIIPAELIFEVLKRLGTGHSPTLNETENLLEHHPNGASPFGWRIENFMADLMLGCREGHRFSNADRRAIDALFYRRTGPIAATIAVTVEVPDDAELGE
jgi:hypothetical protein